MTQLMHALDNFLASSEFQTKLSMEASSQTAKESEWLHGNCLQSKHSFSKGRNPDENADSPR